MVEIFVYCEDLDICIYCQPIRIALIQKSNRPIRIKSCFLIQSTLRRMQSMANCCLMKKCIVRHSAAVSTKKNASIWNSHFNAAIRIEKNASLILTGLKCDTTKNVFWKLPIFSFVFFLFSKFFYDTGIAENWKVFQISILYYSVQRLLQIKHLSKFQFLTFYAFYRQKCRWPPLVSLMLTAIDLNSC